MTPAQTGSRDHHVALGRDVYRAVGFDLLEQPTHFVDATQLEPALLVLVNAGKSVLNVCLRQKPRRAFRKQFKARLQIHARIDRRRTAHSRVRVPEPQLKIGRLGREKRCKHDRR